MNTGEPLLVRRLVAAALAFSGAFGIILEAAEISGVLPSPTRGFISASRTVRTGNCFGRTPTVLSPGVLARATRTSERG